MFICIYVSRNTSCCLEFAYCTLKLTIYLSSGSKLMELTRYSGVRNWQNVLHASRKEVFPDYTHVVNAIKRPARTVAKFEAFWLPRIDNAKVHITRIRAEVEGEAARPVQSMSGLRCKWTTIIRPERFNRVKFGILFQFPLVDRLFHVSDQPDSC